MATRRGTPRAGAPWLRNLRERIALDIGGGLPSLAKNPIEMISPVAKDPIKMIPPVAKNPVEMGKPNMQWWANDGYNSIQEAIQSGNYTFKMGEGFVKNPDAVTPAMEEAAAVEKVAYQREEGGPTFYGTQEEVDAAKAKEAARAAMTDEDGRVLPGMAVEPEKADPSIKTKTVIDPVTKAISTVPVDPVTEAITDVPVDPVTEAVEEAVETVKPNVGPQSFAELFPSLVKDDRSLWEAERDKALGITTQWDVPVDPVTEAVETAVGGGATTTAPPVEEIVAPTMAPPEIVADPVTTAVNAAVGGGSTATAPPPATMGASSSADLGTLGTSGVATMDSPPVQMGEQTITLPGGQTVVIPSQEEIMANIAKMGGEPEVVQETAQTETLIDPVTAAVNQATGNTQERVDLPYADEPQVTAAVNQAAGNTEETTVDPVTAAVNAAVGGGQSTTDDTVLDTDAPDFPITGDTQVGTALMTYHYNPLTGETYESTGSLDRPPEGFIPMDENYTPGMGTGGGAVDAPVGEQEPDFMTQLNELIAQMQGEQTTAAEAQAAAQAAEQQKMNEMSQNYVVGGSAMGYNPYMSGQYQSNPYGPAGAPDMGGITSIPVPAPLQNFEQPQDQPTAMELFNAGYQSPRTTTST